MSLSSLSRWGGLAAAVAGVLFIISDLLTLFAHELNTREGLAFSLGSAGGSLLRSALALSAGVLLSLGLVGLYAHYSETIGILGLVGFLGAFVGSVLGQQNFAFAPIGLVLGRPIFALAALLADVGWTLFGVAVLRSRAFYPRVAAMILIAGVVLLGVVNALMSVPRVGLTAVQIAGAGVVFEIVFSTGVVWLGYELFTRREQE